MRKTPSRWLVITAAAAAFGVLAFLLVQAVYMFELGRAGLLTRPWVPGEALGDTLTIHPASFAVLVGLFLLAALRLRKILDDRAEARGEAERAVAEAVRLAETMRREADRMVELSRVSAHLAALTDPSAVMAAILENAVGLIGPAAGSLYIWVDEARVLRSVRDYRLPDAAVDSMIPAGRGAAGRAFSERAPVFTNDYERWPDATENARRAGVCAALAVPLVRSTSALGALLLTRYDRERPFTEEDARLLALFADQAVSALTHAEAFQKQAAAVSDLERISKAKSDFISIVSHEFRTPLTGIQGFAELIRDENLSPAEMKEYANDITVDARRLNRMVTEMLDLDRLKSGRMTLNLEPVDFGEIVRETVDHMAPMAHSHRMTTRLAPLPRFAGDRDRLVEVVTNLLSNAVKYSPDGGEIAVALREERGAAHLTVRDEGLGIPAEALELIFERFSRIDTGTTRYIQGTGLGLPITRQIVEMHGGRVWAESTPGVGSTFHVMIPLHSAA